MRKWKFHGRQEQLDQIRRLLEDDRGFRAKAITGRRGIGKTELIRESLKAAQLPEGQPVVMLEVKNTTAATMDEMNDVLEKSGQTHLLGDMKDPEDGALTGYSREYALKRLFRRRVEHLLAKGAVVVLDEFHHISDDGGLGMEGTFKIILDSHSGDRRSETHGKLIVAGSHQQRMIEMLREDRPLYLRIDTLPVPELDIASLLRIAAEQGWLKHPERFMTMYSIYGHIPGLWERYYRDMRDVEDLDSIESDDEWLRAFLKQETNRCLSSRFPYAYDNPSHTSLSDDSARLLAYVTMTGKYRGVRVDTVRENTKPKGVTAETWNRRFRNSLLNMTGHLDILGVSDHDITPNTKLWISDPTTLFQIQVQQEDRKLSRKEKGLSPKDRVGRLLDGIMELQAEREGKELERLTARWMSARGLTAGMGFRRGKVEIDAQGTRLVKQSDGTHIREMMVASCKRNPHRLTDSGDLDSMARIYAEHWKEEDDSINRSRRERDEMDFPVMDITYSVRKLAVTPMIPDGFRLPNHIGADELIDIREMARQIGIDPDTGLDNRVSGQE